MASKNATPWAMNQPTHWTQPDGSKDPSTPPFRKLLRSGDFFSAERKGLSEPKMYNKGWNLQTCGPTPGLEMAMFFLKCCSFCSCPLANEWREKMINYVHYIYIYRTVAINDNPVHIFTGQASKNPCLLDFANTRKKTHPATAKIHFISPASGAKICPETHPQQVNQDFPYGVSMQPPGCRSYWTPHGGGTKIQPIFSNLLGP